MFKLLKIFTVVCLFTLPSAYASTQANELPTSLTIGTGKGYYPYYFYNDGKIEGIFPEVIAAISKQLGFNKVEYIVFPWSRLLMKGKRGHVDAILPLIKTDERLYDLNFPEEVIIYEENVLISLAAAPFNYTGNLKSLEEIKLGIVQNYSYGKQFDALDRSNMVVMQDKEHLLNMLLSSRLKVIVGNQLLMENLLKKIENSSELFINRTPISTTALHIAFSKNKGPNGKHLADSFSRAIAELKAKGVIKSITEKYGFKSH